MIKGWLDDRFHYYGTAWLYP